MDKKLAYIIPPLVIFVICLRTTLNYKWPLGWDIFYHIHLAQIYVGKGFTFFDPVYNAPGGRFINYPPLFHLLLTFFSLALGLSPFEISRFMQPFFAAFIVLSVTIVGARFYDSLAGIFAGILLISAVIATRIILPLPENMALIFLPVSIYFYYKSIKTLRLKFACASGALMGIIALIHSAATLCLFVSVTFITFILVVAALKKNINLKIVISNYGIFILSGFIIASFWWLPSLYLKSLGVSGGVETALPFSVRTSILNYPKALGYLVCGFAIIGLARAYKGFGLRDLFIISWILSMFILSKAYYFGINVISYRVLIYILLPLSILAGSGLESAFRAFREVNRSVASVFLILIFSFSLFQAVVNFSSSKIADFGVLTAYGRVSIAPPTEGEVELAEWFKKEADKHKVASFSNYYTGVFIMAYSRQPVNPLLEHFQGIPGDDELRKENIAYLVYDKRLKMYDNLPFVSFENLLYYNPNMVNLSDLDYDYLKKIYENEEFIVYMVI
ncbi:MAG: hypothetical protein QFX38_06675 [Methanothermobacter sp.]|nr:hypothetical protein [Methanothermobacter sp.]